MAAQFFKNGDYVSHSNLPDWGIGKVLEILDGGNVRVFFENKGDLKMQPEFLTPAPRPNYHPLLDRIDRTRTVEGFIPFPDLEKSFLKVFPQGFNDPTYLNDERNYKLEASRFLHEMLPRGMMAELIASNSYATVCDLAKRVVTKTNLIFPNEKMALADGLKRGEREQQLFAQTLFDLLYGDGELAPRFDAFVSALEDLDACKWTTATYFLFLLDPKHHIFVKPSYFQTAASSYLFEIDYVTRPEWTCYRRILDFVEYIAKQLGRSELLRPDDLIDVQGFIWCSIYKG